MVENTNWKVYVWNFSFWRDRSFCKFTGYTRRNLLQLDKSYLRNSLLRTSGKTWVQYQILNSAPPKALLPRIVLFAFTKIGKFLSFSRKKERQHILKYCQRFNCCQRSIFVRRDLLATEARENATENIIDASLIYFGDSISSLMGRIAANAENVQSRRSRSRALGSFVRFVDTEREWVLAFHKGPRARKGRRETRVLETSLVIGNTRYVARVSAALCRLSIALCAHRDENCLYIISIILAHFCSMRWEKARWFCLCRLGKNKNYIFKSIR